MKFLGWDLSRTAEARSAPVSSQEMPLNSAEFLEFLGINQGALPSVTYERALKVPAFAAAMNFLPASMASLPKHVYKAGDGENPDRAGGSLQRILNEAPNPEWSAYNFWKYFWGRVFQNGRGLAWIERSGTNIVALWPMSPCKTTVRMVAGRKFYQYQGQTDPYPAADVIDVPFMLREDQVSVYSPLNLAEKAIQLALAMNEYASGFFAGGGVPPLSIEGPIEASDEAKRRALQQIKRSIELAKESGIPIVRMPAGYKLNPIGMEPEKGQLTNARLFQVQEIGRVLNLPPVFLQDLSTGTFSNTEQQDLSLVKHNLSQWARASEDEMNLKLFGPKRNSRYVEHNMDAIMRGAFKDRIEALARGVQTSLLMPDEARALENRPPLPNGLGAVPYVQGATVPLGSQPTTTTTTVPPDAGNGNGDTTNDN